MWLNELWRRWMGQSSRQLRRRCRSPRIQKRLNLEALEDRTLLSAPVSTTGELIDAINAANQSGTPTTITLAADPNVVVAFDFTSAAPENGPTALPVITGNITIVGNNDLIERDSRAGAFRLFDVASGGSLTLQNLTLQGGLAEGVGAQAEGGAVSSSGTLRLSGVTVKSNKALGSSGADGVEAKAGTPALGGGLFVSGGSVSLTNDLFSANIAWGGSGGNGNFGGKGGLGAGGGLFAAGGSVSLSNNTFSGNRAIGGTGGNGIDGIDGGYGGDGGDAAGGALVVVSAASFTSSGDTFSDDRAIGGSGGSGGPGGVGGDGGESGIGGRGGVAEGGGLAFASVSKVILSNDTFTSNHVEGGSGGNGGNGLAGANGGSGANGGFGADGGMAGMGGDGQGGGLFVGGGTATLSNVALSSNVALGGRGGNGGNGGDGGNGASSATGGFGGNGGIAGIGGNGQGGGLFVGSMSNITLSNDTLNNNVADGSVGGSGGLGGNGGSGVFGNNNGGSGGVSGLGGDGIGGGLDMEGAGNVTLSNDTLNHNNANGGAGGFARHGGSGGVSLIHGINGPNAGNGGEGFGGGLAVESAASVTLTADTLSGNEVIGGSGGKGGTGGSNASFPGNPGSGGLGGAGGSASGGGLYLFSVATSINLTNDTLFGNVIVGGRGGDGGNGGDAHYSLFHNNPTPGPGGNGGVGGNGSGGGLFVSSGAVSMVNDTVSGNVVIGGTGGTGGGAGNPIGNFPGVEFIPNPVLSDGGNGGDVLGGGLGVAVNDTAVHLANTLIANDLIVAGTGGVGGPGYGGSSGPSGPPGAVGNASGPDVSGNVTSSDRDLIGDGSGSNLSNGDTGGDLVGYTDAQLDLGPLQNNGGPTNTMALLLNSPAIDAGDNKAVAGISTDQRGFARIVGNAVDIGAYEFGATPATSSLSISGSGSSSTTPGGPITYTFIVSNTSSTAQSNVDVTDSLPANTTLVSWTAAAGWSSSAPPPGSSSGTVSASIASLAANSSATFTLVVQVAPGAPVHTVISNTASFGPFADLTNPSANNVSINTTVLYAPTLRVVDGGTYNGNPFLATATAVGIDGTTPVAGSFSYAYYAGSSASGTPLSSVPVNAGTYTVVATFTSNNPDYMGGSTQTTFTISPAPISYTIGNDTQAYGYPANLAADLPSSFSTGINGETLDIAYGSSGDTSTAPVGTYAITGVVSNGTGLASNYSVTLTNGTLTVLGSGVTVVGSTLWIVGGTTTNDHVDVDPAGASWTGSTGVKVDATLDHVHTSTTYSQSFTALYIFLYSGNDHVSVAPSLTLNTTLGAGNGNDDLQLDNGNNTLTLGNGNDNVVAGGGNNVVTAGAGNDNVLLGCGNNVVTLGNGNDNVVTGGGNNTVTLGNGNDNTLVGNGDNVVVEGNGNDNVVAGNGDNLIVAGLGRHTVVVGNGSNILIDGSVQLTQSGDSLRQVLDDWILYGDQSANVTSIRSRLSVTYNTHYANTLHAGSGLDWFWATDTQDHLNVKKTDLLN